MPKLEIEPTNEHPVPYDVKDEKPSTLLDELAVAGNTVELQEALGAEFDLSEKDLAKEKELIESVVRDKKTKNLNTPTTALAAASFLRTYGSQLALDAAQARAAITNKLMEIADCGDPRFELKALELLGKHSDIGVFTERSEVTIKYKSPEELENEIRSRIKRLLNAQVVETVPVHQALEEDFGGLDLDDEDTGSSLLADLDDEIIEPDDDAEYS